MHEIDDGISETKNLELFGAECWRAAEGLRLPTLAGHGIPKCCAGVQARFSSGSCRLVPPAAELGGRTICWFCGLHGLVGCWTRHGCNAGLDFNEDTTFLARVCGDRPDWPVSDHFGRCSRVVAMAEGRGRVPLGIEWPVHGKGRGRKIGNVSCVCAEIEKH